MNFLFAQNTITPLEAIHDPLLTNAGVSLWVKRDDLIHPDISGNKWRKLKYNFIEAERLQKKTLLTFGGAYSNHLYALAAAGNLGGFKTIGIVRGQELSENSSPGLAFCYRSGMKLVFIDREEYRLKDASPRVRQLAEQTNSFVVPEGGSNIHALKGVEELADEVCLQLKRGPDYFAVAAGTGGTAAGLLSAGQKVIAFSALKNGQFLKADIEKLLPPDTATAGGLLDLQTNYHFGGYARHTPALLKFMSEFEIRTSIPLEQVYTAKMFWGLYDLIAKGYFASGTRIVAVHTGGLQGRLPR